MPYFDYNATTPPAAAALQAARLVSEQAWHNPSSPYRTGAQAHILLELARENLATLLGAAPEEYVFTSGATEANNAVFAHFAKNSPANARAVVSAIEHPSVLEAAQYWFPHRVSLIPVNEQGVADLDSLRKLFRAGNVAVVSLLAANNETGVLQPWTEAAKICREQGVPFHCDATQWLGKLPPGGLADCDFFTGSAHKFGGLKGAGFLKINSRLGHFHGQRGGEQEHGHRAGTENLAGIHAMLAALAGVAPSLDSQTAEWGALREQFEESLKAAVPGVVIVGEKAPRLWNTVMLIVPQHDNLRWVAALDKRGFQISTGSACATGREGPSHVLAALGVDADAARRALRVSAGWGATAQEWSGLAAAFGEAATTLAAG
ncbi:MAG TPA: cysteine desulfurase family protein [Opitutales bacterium]|nr:cysteine desulfurase family protein [Opitutales bacterium]